MSTTLITPTRTFMNKLTKAGREANELCKDLQESGYNNIYQKTLKNGKIALLADGKTDFFAVIDAKSNKVYQKTVSRPHIQSILPIKAFCIEKVVGDLKGNIERFKHVATKKLNGETICEAKTLKTHKNGSTYKMVKNENAKTLFYKEDERQNFHNMF